MDAAPLSPTGDLELVAELAGMRSLLARIADGINRGSDWGTIDRLERLTWADGSTAELDLGRNAPGIGIYNRSRVTAYVGLSPNRGNAAQAELKVPAGAWRTLPLRAAWVSVGGAGAGECELVVFAVPPPFDGGMIGERPTLTTTAIDVNSATTTALVAAPGVGYALRVVGFGLTLASGDTGELRAGGSSLTGQLKDPGAAAHGTADDPVFSLPENTALNLVTVGAGGPGADGWVTWFAEAV